MLGFALLLCSAIPPGYLEGPALSGVERFRLTADNGDSFAIEYRSGFYYGQVWRSPDGVEIPQSMIYARTVEGGAWMQLDFGTSWDGTGDPPPLAEGGYNATALGEVGTFEDLLVSTGMNDVPGFIAGFSFVGAGEFEWYATLGEMQTAYEAYQAGGGGGEEPAGDLNSAAGWGEAAATVMNQVLYAALPWILGLLGLLVVLGLLWSGLRGVRRAVKGEASGAVSSGEAAKGGALVGVVGADGGGKSDEYFGGERERGGEERYKQGKGWQDCKCREELEGEGESIITGEYFGGEGREEDVIVAERAEDENGG